MKESCPACTGSGQKWSKIEQRRFTCPTCAGLLPAQVNRVGQRVRYAIAPADAATYAARKQTTKGSSR